MGILGRVIVCLVLLAGRARADDVVGGVLDVRKHKLAFTRLIPADVSQKLSIQVAGSDVASATLDVWPHTSDDPCELTPPADGTTQRQHLALTVGGTADARTLEATIAPLQIATRYCFAVDYERPAGDSAELVDAISHLKVPWQDACGKPDVRAAVTAAVAEAIGPRLARTAYDAKGDGTTLDSKAEVARATPRISKVIVERLDLNAKCNAILHVEAVYAEDLKGLKSAGKAQQDALAALQKLPAKIRAWPVLMVGTPATPIRLIDLVASQADVKAVLAMVGKVAPDLEPQLRAYASESDPKAMKIARAALEQRLQQPPPNPLEVALYLPSAKQLVVASELATPKQREHLIVELVAAPDAFDQQLELLGRQDHAVAEAWRPALAALAKDGQAYADADRAVIAARAARETELNNPVSTTLTKDNISKLLVESDVTVGATFSSVPALADDKASWVSPVAGVLVAAPFIHGLDASRQRVLHASDAWLAPYLGGSIYTCRVDRVIDVGALVGNTTCQRLSITVGVLASTPQINHKDVRGPWSITVVPTAGAGYRVTQYFHADVGVIPFQYANENPAISAYRWGLAIWFGASLDADVWAVIGGKLGK